jgi:hypothetical protein
MGIDDESSHPEVCSEVAGGVTRDIMCFFRERAGLNPFRNGYRTAGRRNNRDIYKAEEIDFLVAYIAPLDIWYIIPVKHIAALCVLPLYPSGCKRGGHFECYPEAWYLMASAAAATTQSRILPLVHAMACQQSSGLSIGRDIRDIPRYPRATSPSYIDTHPAGP